MPAVPGVAPPIDTTHEPPYATHAPMATHNTSNTDYNSHQLYTPVSYPGRGDIEMGPHDEKLARTNTVSTMTLTPEMFERLYLQTRQPVAGDLRKRFGNPTPLGVASFALTLLTLSTYLMGFRSIAIGQAIIGDAIFLAGMGLFVAGIFEWVLGNTFTFVVFITFAGFYWSYGATLAPAFAVAASYDPAGAGSAAAGAASPAFDNAIGMYLLFWGMLLFTYMILSLRINLAFFLIFFFVGIAFCLLTAQYWLLSQGKIKAAINCGKAAGALCFVSALDGWYIFFVQLADSVGFPVLKSLPLGDFGKFWPDIRAASAIEKRD